MDPYTAELKRGETYTLTISGSASGHVWVEDPIVDSNVTIRGLTLSFTK